MCYKRAGESEAWSGYHGLGCIRDVGRGTAHRLSCPRHSSYRPSRHASFASGLVSACTSDPWMHMCVRMYM